MTLVRRPPVPIAALLIVLASGCTSTASGTPSPTPEPTAAPTQSAAPADTAEPTNGADATATLDTTVFEAWAATATQHRGMEGHQVEYDCPAGGEARFIWGTDVYTDDSSVCTAGVHVGAITLEEGGTVTVEIRAGEDEYEASERNGVESQPYGPWAGSFVVIGE